MKDPHTGADRSSPGDPPPPTVWPALRARDARTLIDWLVHAIGFVEVVAYTADGRIEHAELAWPEGGGVILDDERPGAPWSPPTGAAGVHVVTADVDAVFRRARTAGAEIVVAPADNDYGSRECAVRYPEGNHWSFGTYRGAPLRAG